MKGEFIHSPACNNEHGHESVHAADTELALIIYNPARMTAQQHETAVPMKGTFSAQACPTKHNYPPFD
jgi:hypothetical protein